MTEPTTGHKVAAEIIGMFVLVFFGCGTALMSGGNYVATGMAFGLTVLVMVYAVGRISGGHFNPAVTLGAAIGGRLAWSQVLVYMGAQLFGALLAGASLFTLMHGFEDFDAKGNMAQNSFGDDGTGYAWWAALLLELLMTMIFVWVILAVTDTRNEHPALAPLAIGLALTMIHFGSIAATGTSVNPARSIGVAVFAGTDAIMQLWLFILAPLLGGAIAGVTYAALFGLGAAPVPGSGLAFSRPPQPVVPGYGATDQYQQQWNQPEAEQAAPWPSQPAAEPPQWTPEQQAQWEAQQQQQQQQWQQPPPAQPPPAQPPPQQQQPPQQPPGPDDGDPERTQIRPPQGP